MKQFLLVFFLPSLAVFFISCYPVFRGFTGFSWVLLGFTGFFLVLPSFTGSLRGFADWHQILSQFLFVLPSFTHVNRVLVGLDWF